MCGGAVQHNSNLGNTADETSFRGLHLELRRAFDLVSTAQLEECCEQYEFPKEEKLQRIGKQQHQNPLSFGVLHSPIRAEAGEVDRIEEVGIIIRTIVMATIIEGHQVVISKTILDLFLSQGTCLLMRPGFNNKPKPNYTTICSRPIQCYRHKENSLRQQLYNQSQMYLQAQNGSQAYGPIQNRTQGNGAGHQQPSDRNRTASFDQPPLTAPIRPEFYLYPLNYHPHSMYGYQSPSTNPRRHH